MIHEKYGFVNVASEVAASEDEAAAIATRLGFPVVLKIASPDIIHKSDVGGVVLGCKSEDEVRVAFSEILLSVKEQVPEARIDGISVEEMCQGGVEIIVGLNNDQQFGPVLMFGLGGIYTELLNDISFRVLPITEDDARAMIGEIKGRRILEGFRGQPPVSERLLIDLLMNANRMGLDLAETLDSVDFNPILVWGDNHRVLDAKVLLRPAGAPSLDSAPNTSFLATFFGAKSVALVGASATPGKIGHAVLESLAGHEYRGKVYPVNPGKDQIMGLQAYPSVSSIPERVDMVVVTAALSLVPDIILECAAKEIHSMVIVSGGGKELGGESEDLEQRIKLLAEANRVRVIGCNCIGVFDGETRIDTFFQPHDRLTRPKKGPVAMITQSGTVGAAFLEAAADIGVSKFVSYGNRIDVDEADLISFLAEDPDTRVIACYIEGFSNGRKFLAAASKVAPSKPVVVYKAGRSRQAAKAAVSHTGFFGGTHALVEGALRQASVIAVDSVEELYAVSKALALQPRAAGPRVAMISNGAGTMVQALDLFESHGLVLASLTSKTSARLAEAYPSFYLSHNPVDVTGSATSADYRVGIEALLEDPNVDIIMPWFVFPNTSLDGGIVDALGALSRGAGKPIICGTLGGSYTRRISGAIQDRGVPMCFSVKEWVAAASGAASAGKVEQRLGYSSLNMPVFSERSSAQ